MALTSFEGQYTIAWNDSSSCLPAAFFLLVQRYLVSGMTSGAVKGRRYQPSTYALASSRI